MIQIINMENLLNISPIDGRYHNQTYELNQYFSEYGFFKYRTKIEIEYFLYLKKLEINELKDISNDNIEYIRQIYDNFSPEECFKIKNIESNTNHDVKSIEYYLQSKFEKLGLSNYVQFIHFGLTSQDINNTALTLMIKDCINDIIIPYLSNILDNLFNKTLDWSDTVMLTRTHGQTAVPSTLGKEIQVFHFRISKQLKILKEMPYYGKFGGAVGNLNAHYQAYPYENWEINFTNFLVELGLNREILTTQIDNYENLANIFDCLRRINTIIIDFNRDIWQYISNEYLVQKFNENEIGSSTMPHKINPINFENSEGNLLLANALLDFMSNKLPVSRLQRDLTDSTIIRNIGTIFGHMLIAYSNLIKGLNKLEINKTKINDDLTSNINVLTEAIQIILKKYGFKNSYEKVKEIFRNNKKIQMSDIKEFINNLEISDLAKAELNEISILNYIGNSKHIKKY